jgi:hypothetical protein
MDTGFFPTEMQCSFVESAQAFMGCQSLLTNKAETDLYQSLP